MSEKQEMKTDAKLSTDATDAPAQMEPLMVSKTDASEIPMGNSSGEEGAPTGFVDKMIAQHCSSNPEFFQQAFKFAMCFCGLQLSYLTWGIMQELIMTREFNPTDTAPDGRFPSAAFVVFSNRFLAVLVAMIAVRIKHGAVFSNNKAPLIAFTPCALSNTMSSWSQYASLKWVSFPVQTVFKSSKIIPVMIMGKMLKGTSYPWGQYVEALFITLGVAVFSVASKSSDSDTATEFWGVLFLLLYISFDSFTSQWQDRVYTKYGRENVDPYQMMLGVNSSAICITIAGLIISGDFPKVYDFFLANPNCLWFNVVTAITSASGQLCIFYTIKEFGPIVFTIIMTTRQMISITISAVLFGHEITAVALLGALLVFSVLFYQIRRKYYARQAKKQAAPNLAQK
eukprot:CAMPEP_0194046640 /NCGR_PEP_ID=MMETSP0009_2-20130614/22050_1 /TAXON_ID=210454 /ORGANISM="Grammatophora oceanica, Strain CCMP 410" /LENGTH=397 /DNA_ID=CAMNT_0038692011 /DNA_START=97 /DNA_END=1290 /DNA_ORIENTATION=+